MSNILPPKLPRCLFRLSKWAELSVSCERSIGVGTARHVRTLKAGTRAGGGAGGRRKGEGERGNRDATDRYCHQRPYDSSILLTDGGEDKPLYPAVFVA